jgi:hypothetical protein
MLGTIAIRLALIVALIGVAHAIKPFSIKSVTQHLVYSTRSFSFILPNQTRAQVSLAGELALNLSDRLFEFGEAGRVSGDEGLLLAQASLRPAAKIWPPEEVGKPCRKTKSPKRAIPGKRNDGRGARNEMTVAALSAEPGEWTAGEEAVLEEEDAVDVAMPAPVHLPVAMTPQPVAIRDAALGFLFTMENLAKPGCSDTELNALRLATGLQILKPSRVILLRAEKPKSPTPECETEKPDAGKPSLTVEVTEEEEAVEPEPMKEEEAEPALPEAERPVPLKCPTEP